MWSLLFSAALAAPTAPAGADDAAIPAEPASRPAIGLEGGLSLTVPVPFAGLGPGPGLRFVGDVAVIERLTVGLELGARFPGVAAATLSDRALGEDLEWRTSLTVLSGGARVAYAFGPLDGLHGRVALAGGVAWLAQDTVTQVGTTHDAVLTGWIQPEVGALYPLGPGALTGDLIVPVAPADLLVSRWVPAGTGVAFVVGYRFEL